MASRIWYFWSASLNQRILAAENVDSLYLSGKESGHSIWFTT